MGRVESISHLARFKIKSGEPFIRPAEQRPAEVARRLRTVDFVIARWRDAAFGIHIHAHIAPHHLAGGQVAHHAERVAATHGENFRPALLGVLEQIAFGNAVTALRQGFNAQDLSAQVVGIAGAAQGIGQFVAGALIDGQFGNGRGIVADAYQNAAFGITGDPTAKVIRALFLDRNFNNGPFQRRVDFAFANNKARQPHHALFFFRAVEDEKCARLSEVGIERHTHQAHFTKHRCLHPPQSLRGLARRHQQHASRPFDQNHGAVVQHVNAHGIGKSRHKRGAFEALGIERGLGQNH